MDYYSTQGWVYIVISLIATIVAFSINIYLTGPGVFTKTINDIHKKYFTDSII